MITTSRHPSHQQNAETWAVPDRRSYFDVMGGPDTGLIMHALGGPDRGPRLNLMGGPDGGLIGDAMGGPDRGPRLSVMGGPDRGPRVSVMGGPDLVTDVKAEREVALRPVAFPFSAAKRYSRRELTRAAS
jgi:hypothetical protein